MAVRLLICSLSSSKFREKIRKSLCAGLKDFRWFGMILDKDGCCAVCSLSSSKFRESPGRWVCHLLQSSPGVRGWSWKVSRSLSEHDFQVSSPSQLEDHWNSKFKTKNQMVLIDFQIGCLWKVGLWLGNAPASGCSPCRNFSPRTSRIPRPKWFQTTHEACYVASQNPAIRLCFCKGRKVTVPRTDLTLGST